MNQSDPTFNPYIEWLGLSPALLPANHYDLLGLPLFETSLEAIEKAADERMRQIRSYQTGPRGRSTQDLLNELTTARLCLLNEKAKAEYDLALRQGKLDSPLPPTAPPPTAAGKLEAAGQPGDEGQSGGSDSQAAWTDQIVESSEQTAFPQFQIRDDEADTEHQNTSPSASHPGKTQLSRTYVLMAIGFVAVIGGGSLLWNFVFTKPPAAAGSASDPTNQPAAKLKKKKIKNELSGQGLLPATNNRFLLTPENGQLSGDHLILATDGSDSIVKSWTSNTDHVVWEVWFEEPGYYEVVASYSASSHGTASRIKLRLDESFTKSVTMQTGQSASEKLTEQFIILIRKPGTHVIRFSAENEPGDFLFRSLEVRPQSR